MAEFIASILETYLEIKHYFKVRKRRKFEKKNNLPKKRMISPLDKIWILVAIILIPILCLKFYSLRRNKITLTNDKINEIELLLEAEKLQFGFYPKELKQLIRNNPLRKNITLDGWQNEFSYNLSKDSLNYELISLGKDRKLDTSDDIKITN